MRTVKGFMGRTHALLSIMLMLICMLIPFFKDTLGSTKSNILFFIVCLVVLVGGALLPDLDNAESSAGSTLGFVGSIFTTFMQLTSSIIWNLVHTKRERKPDTPHRYFWHTLIAGGGILAIFWFLMPTGGRTLWNIITSGEILTILQNNAILIFFIIMMFASVLCGSNMIIYRLIKWFHLPKIINYIFPVLATIYIFTLDYTHLRILGICIGLGYLFHCLEDFFADSGVPLLFPIPIAKKCWFRCRFILTVQTGGIINTIIDVVILVVDIVLMIIVFGMK